MGKTLKLFSNCILVRGAKKSIICDLQKNEFHIIPEILLEYFQNNTTINTYKLQSIDNKQEKQKINKHIEYLISNELAFYCEKPENFPELEEKWEFPGEISNSIIEIKNIKDHNFENIFKQLEILGCRYLELRFYYKTDVSKIEAVLNLLSESKIRNINLLIKYSKEIDEKKLELMKIRNQRIGNITIHSSQKDYQNKNIFFTTQIIQNNDCCGNVSIEYFSCNIEHYMESRLFNNCLNKKISISPNGDIKNCPSTRNILGNINSEDLNSIITHKNTKILWGITKDMINICKDCEFRYICVDCRAHITDSSNIFSKPLKCSYNPYTGNWADGLKRDISYFKNNKS